MRPRQAWKCEHTHRAYRALGLCNACYLRQNGGSARWYDTHKKKAIRRATKWNQVHLTRRREISQASGKRRYSHHYLLHHLECILRSRLGIALRGYHKASSTMTLVGCSIPQLKTHIESQFLPGMSWGNHNLRGWHIDHKKPCSAFDLSDPRQQAACFHYTNLQPLWALDNLSKGAKT